MRKASAAGESIFESVYSERKLRPSPVTAAETVTDTLLRRLPDYVNFINFQPVPVVDTSNPFISRDIPSPDESMVVIRFAQPKGIDFQYLHNMIDGF